MLMSGLRLSLLSDAVCHKGNSPSQLAILGVTEELVGTVSRLKLNCPWWSHERSLVRRLAATCGPPDTWPRASNIVFWRRCARRWSVYWISPLLGLKVCQRRNVELVTSVCVIGKVASSTEVIFKELKPLPPQNLLDRVSHVWRKNRVWLGYFDYVFTVHELCAAENGK